MQRQELRLIAAGISSQKFLQQIFNDAAGRVLPHAVDITFVPRRLKSQKALSGTCENLFRIHSHRGALPFPRHTGMETGQDPVRGSRSQPRQTASADDAQAKRAGKARAHHPENRARCQRPVASQDGREQKNKRRQAHHRRTQHRGTRRRSDSKQRQRDHEPARATAGARPQRACATAHALGAPTFDSHQHLIPTCSATTPALRLCTSTCPKPALFIIALSSACPGCTRMDSAR